MHHPFGLDHHNLEHTHIPGGGYCLLHSPDLEKDRTASDKTYALPAMTICGVVLLWCGATVWNNIAVER